MAVGGVGTSCGTVLAFDKPCWFRAGRRRSKAGRRPPRAAAFRCHVQVRRRCIHVETFLSPTWRNHGEAGRQYSDSPLNEKRRELGLPVLPIHFAIARATASLVDDCTGSLPLVGGDVAGVADGGPGIGAGRVIADTVKLFATTRRSLVARTRMRTPAARITSSWRTIKYDDRFTVFGRVEALDVMHRLPVGDQRARGMPPLKTTTCPGSSSSSEGRPNPPTGHASARLQTAEAKGVGTFLPSLPRGRICCLWMSYEQMPIRIELRAVFFAMWKSPAMDVGPGTAAPRAPTSRPRLGHACVLPAYFALLGKSRRGSISGIIRRHGA